MNKELCGCGKIAVWIYMPGRPNGGSPFFCDNCVHRGCSCNYRYVDLKTYGLLNQPPDLPEPGQLVKWVDNHNAWTKVDEQGREYPCVEYDFEAEGFDVENEA